MKPRSHRGTGLIPLAFVIQGDSKLRVPAPIEASPIAYRDWEAAVGTRIASRAAEALHVVRRTPPIKGCS
jgi:hypothetical protein